MKGFGSKFAERVVRYRWWIIAITLVLFFAAAGGVTRLKTSNDLRVFFSDKNPQLEALESLENTYTKDHIVVFGIAPEDGEVFTKTTLTALEEMTEAAWQIPYSSRVDSLTNFQNTYSEDDDLIVEDLVLDAGDYDAQKIEEIKTIALNEPLLVNRLVSPTGHVTGLMVNIILPGKAQHEVLEVVGASRKLVSDFEAKYSGLSIKLTGGPVFDAAFGEANQRDMSILTPIMFAVLILLVGLSLRSFTGTFATIVIILFSMMTAMGLAGWLGITLTSASGTAPIIILTLAVADSVHILASIFKKMRKGTAKFKAIAGALSLNLQAVTLTSLTTAVGFLTMNFSDAPPFRTLGNIVAMGVTAALVYSVFFLPALIAVLPVRIKKGGPKSRSGLMDGFADFVIRRRRPILWGTVALIIALTIGLTRIELDDNFKEYFSDRYPIRRASDFVEANLTGLDAIEYSLESGQKGGISDPEYLKRIEGFAAWYRQQEGVVHVYTITDIVKRLNKNLHNDEESYYRIPDQRDLAAQYLLLYEMSLPFGLDLNNRINVEKSASRMTVILKSKTTRQLRAMDKDARTWLAANAPGSMQTLGSGLSVIWAHISERNINSMLLASFGGLVIISIILIFALRSIKIGILSLIPNIAPALMAFGIWGFTISRVGLGLSIIVSMTIGIVVDDTIHFLSKYLRARREKYMDPQAAVRYSFSTVGHAMWITTVALVAGFAVLSFSGYQMTAHMGIMTAITISLALAMDFLLLPTLLIKMEEFKMKNVKPNWIIAGILLALAVSAFAFADEPATVEVSQADAPAVPPATAAPAPEEKTDIDIDAITDPGAKGLAIAAEADKRDSGWGDATVNIKMVLKNKHGQKSQRQLHSKMLEVEDDGNKGITVFDTPRDVKGTAFLSVAHKTKDDDQWIYLPALKRVKRISSRNKSGSFMGSEFSYEDIASPEVEKYTYTWLRTEEYNEQECHVVERVPVDKKNSGYSRLVTWYDTAEYRVVKVNYFDRKNAHLKTLTFEGYTLYAGKYWRPDAMHMVNHQNGKSTVLSFSDYKFQTGLKARDFTKNSLKRAK